MFKINKKNFEKKLKINSQIAHTLKIRGAENKIKILVISRAIGAERKIKGKKRSEADQLNVIGTIGVLVSISKTKFELFQQF